MNLRGRVDRLDKTIPPLPEPKPEDRAANGLIGLLFDALIDAAHAEAFTDEEADRVRDALKKEGSLCPYEPWFRALREGWCRLPETLGSRSRDR